MSALANGGNYDCCNCAECRNDYKYVTKRILYYPRTNRMVLMTIYSYKNTEYEPSELDSRYHGYPIYIDQWKELK